MTYIRSLFLNFLVVFFVNDIIPGIHIQYFEHVPNIGADLLFAAIVGILNSLIFPFLRIADLKPTLMKIVIIAFVISFTSYIIIAFVPFGVQATSFGGVVFAGILVWAMAVFTNYLEMKHYLPKSE